MLWKKPAGMKYTDLCIYIDKNVQYIAEAGKNPIVEETIYNYLWLLVKALAIKKAMFKNFQDYDGYSFYAASRLFFALRKNYENRGKIIKGKEIRPIKSCLNYTKVLLYPMKIEYQREAYKEIIDEEFVSKKFDALALKDQMRTSAREAQPNNTWFNLYATDTFKNIDKILDIVLKRLPFPVGSLEYKKIRISILLNCIAAVKTKGKLNAEPQTVILWHLPKSMSNYVKVLLKEFCAAVQTEIIQCYNDTTLDDIMVDKILSYKEGPEYDYEDDN